MNLVYIGEYTKIEDRVSIITLNRIPGSMEIGKVNIGDRVLIQCGSSIISSTIKDGAIIGYNSVICEGTVIGENSIIAPNSVVPPYTYIPDNTIFGGNPVVFIGDTQKVDLINT